MKSSTVGVIKQYLAGTSAALSLFVTGAWTGWSSPAVKKISDEHVQVHMNTDEISWIVALMDFGNIISPIPSGYMSDCMGRKAILLLTAILFFVTWMLAVFGSSVEYLYIARTGAGIGKGVAFTVVPMYLGEIARVKNRGSISTVFSCMLQSGLLLEFIIGAFMSYDWLNYTSSIFPIIFFLTFLKMPESPYFYMMKKNEDKAKESLAWFRHANNDDEDLLVELHKISITVQRDMEGKGSFKDLIATPGNRKALTIVIVLSVLQRFGGISPQLSYTVITLPKSGGYINSEMYMIIFAITMVIGTFISTTLMDSVGRKPLLIISSSFCALFTGISAVFYYIAGVENDTHHNWIPYVCFVAFGAAYSFGIGIIPTTFVGELFPTNVKSFASSSSSIFFALASFTTNKVFLHVRDHYGVHCMFIFYTICNIVSVIFTMTTVFETKGRTFSEIQDILNKRSQAE